MFQLGKTKIARTCFLFKKKMLSSFIDVLLITHLKYTVQEH